LQTYADAGVGGVEAGNLDAVNSAVALLDSAATDTRAEVQAVVDAYLAVLNAADGADDNDAKPTQSQLATLGITGVDSPAEASLLGDVIDEKTAADVDRVAELQALADAVSAVMSGAAGGPGPALEQLQALGVTGVTADNLGWPASSTPRWPS